MQICIWEKVGAAPFTHAFLNDKHIRKSIGDGPEENQVMYCIIKEANNLAMFMLTVCGYGGSALAVT